MVIGPVSLLPCVVVLLRGICNSTDRWSWSEVWEVRLDEKCVSPVGKSFGQPDVSSSRTPFILRRRPDSGHLEAFSQPVALL